MTFDRTSPNSTLTSSEGEFLLPSRVLEGLQVGQLVFHLDGLLLHINPQARRWLHLQDMDLEGLSLQDLCQHCHNLNPERIQNLLEHQAQSVEWVQGLQVHYLIVPSQDGSRVGMVVLLPSPAHGTSAPAHNRSTAEALFEISPDCLKYLDVEGRLLRMNRNGQHIMEVDDVSRVEGADWVQFWPEDARPLALKALADARKGQMGRFQGGCPTLKGTLKHWDVVVLPLLEDTTVTGLVVSSRDISREVEQEQRERELLAAQQRFVSEAAHEIRTPIAAILGNLDVLFRYQNIPEDEKQDILRDVHHSASRLSRLVNDMLQLTREKADIRRDEEVPLHEVVLTAWKEARTLSSTHQFDLGEVERIELYGETDRLKQLTVILLDNAIKYTPGGGLIHMNLRAEGLQAVLTVQDSGIGIAPEHQEKVFERFYRVDRTRVDSRDPGGNGLGLPIARWIVEGHGGRIELRSEVGKGTTFQVTLPLEVPEGQLA